MSSFFNNFMNGLAFGLLTSNPFFRGMGGFGFGCGCGYGGIGGFLFGGMYNAVNLTGFANPFPSIFGGGYMGGGYVSSSGLIMPTGFANDSFPTIDFVGPCQSIWDMYTNPQSEYNIQMRDWFQKMNSSQNSPLYNMYEQKKEEQMRDASVSEQESFDKTGRDKTGTAIVKSKSKQKTTTSVKTESKTASSTTTGASVKSSSAKQREFAASYSSLGITDTRFQKIFEECILKSEGREYIFDIHDMAKSGVQQGTYDDYRKRKGLAKRDVANMTETEMCEIYYNIYKECGANKINDDKMALYVFDVAVNSGSGKAKELYKKSGNNPEKFEKLRVDFYKSLAAKNPKKYGSSLNGWLNRVEKTKKYADSNFFAIA